MVRAVFRFLASLKLALILLGVLVVACSFGAVYESSFNPEIARHHVYNAWWFNVWLGVLAVNLFCAAASRYPWKPHQTGFVITHAGIIILIIGGLIDRFYGIEGYVDLLVGAPPVEEMKLYEQELRVSVDGSDAATTPFRLGVLGHLADRSFPAQSPSPEVSVRVKDILPAHYDASHPVADETGKGKPALRFTLEAVRMGRHELALMLGESKLLGPAMVHFKEGTPPEVKAQDPMPEPAEAKKVPWVERFYVFSREDFAAMPVAVSGPPTGAQPKLTLQDGKEPVLVLSFKEKDFTIPVRSNLDKPMPLDGLPEWQVRITGFFADFRLDGGKPTSVSEELKNPAVSFELHGPQVEAGESGEKRNPHGDPHGDPHGEPGGAPPAMDPGANQLTFYLGPDGKLRYHLQSRRFGESAAEIAPGGSFPGFIENSTITLDEFLPHARVEAKFTLDKGVVTNDRLAVLIATRSKRKEALEYLRMASLFESAEGSTTEKAVANLEAILARSIVRLRSEPGDLAAIADLAKNQGYEEAQVARLMQAVERYAKNDPFFNEVYATLLVEVSAGGETKDVLAGWAADPAKYTYVPQAPVQLEVGGKQVRLSFDTRRVPLPFKVALESTRAPHQEGLEGRNAFMAFESTLVFKEGNAEHKADIYMNHPTTFPDTWYGPWLGTGYKFSQARHGMMADPPVPTFSGVQVLRDPGWMPKWAGSLLICFGIFTMFYLKPYFRRKPAAEKRQAVSVPTGEASKKKAVEQALAAKES